jgi:Cu+-exporting ATPase
MIQWISLLAALLAFGLNLLSLGSEGLVSSLACLSMAVALSELVPDPKRALFFSSFLLSFPLVLSLTTLHGQTSTVNALVAVAIALNGRLLLLERAKKSRRRCRTRAAELRKSFPEKALVFVDMDIEGECPLSDLQEGHLIRIRPGDSLPADGQITFGSSFVDESLLTGEKEARTKSMGSFVFGGTKNKNGSFEYRAGSSPKQSFSLRMASLLDRGFPFESLFGKPFFLLEGSLLLGAFLVYAFTGPTLGPLLNVFLVSAVTAAASSWWGLDSAFLLNSSSEGFLWKSKASLRRIASSQMVVSAATGVLTEGRLRLARLQGIGDLSEDGILRLLGPLARRLETDAAFAILQEMQTRGIRLEIMDTFMEMPGGASGLVTGEDIRWVDLENARIENLPLARAENALREALAAGEKAHLLFRGSEVAAVFSFSDRLLPAASQGIQRLKRLEAPYLLISAEGELASRRMREELGISHFSPDSGQKELERLLEKLEADGLHPLWVPSSGWAYPVAAATAAPGHLLPAFSANADCLSIRGDLNSLSRLVAAAKDYFSRSRAVFWLAFSFQAVLLAFCPFLDVRLAAVLGILPGFFLPVGEAP